MLNKDSTSRNLIYNQNNQNLLIFNNKSDYAAIVSWLHGSSLITERLYTFSSKEELKQFCNFIFDIMSFEPNTGFKDLGTFNKDKSKEDINNIIKKYSNIFHSHVETDQTNENNYASVDKIYVLIKGVAKNIIFTKAISTNIISLPKKNSMIVTDKNDFYDDDDEYINLDLDNYSSLFKDKLSNVFNTTSNKENQYIRAKVLDIKVNELDKDDKSYIIAFQYIIVCLSDNKKFTINKYGYDYQFSDNYLENKLSIDNYFLV